MPNNGRITLCPFYRDEKNKSISCEDTFRTFRWLSQKKEWMDTYCDKEWEKCPYAISLNEMYQRIEEGDVMAEEAHNVEALRTELKKMASKLGRAEKRLEPKLQEIESLKSKKKMWEDKYFEEHKKLAQAERRIKDLEGNAMDELVNMARIYEDRMCYMIDMFVPLQKLSESEMKEWAKDKEIALIHEDNEGDVIWKVVKREVPNEE